MEANLAQILEAIEATIPERECLVWRERRLSWSEFGARSRRLARALLSRGLGLHAERGELSPWESGQDHVALYMYNCPEYLEGMVAAFKARLVPVNVNYRYVAAELIGLLRDARARALIYHASFATVVAEIRAELPDLTVLLQVADESGEACRRPPRGARRRMSQAPRALQGAEGVRLPRSDPPRRERQRRLSLGKGAGDGLRERGSMSH